MFGNLLERSVGMYSISKILYVTVQEEWNSHWRLKSLYCDIYEGNRRYIMMVKKEQIFNRTVKTYSSDILNVKTHRSDAYKR